MLQKVHPLPTAPVLHFVFNWGDIWLPRPWSLLAIFIASEGTFSPVPRLLTKMQSNLSADVQCWPFASIWALSNQLRGEGSLVSSFRQYLHVGIVHSSVTNFSRWPMTSVASVFISISTEHGSGVVVKGGFHSKLIHGIYSSSVRLKLSIDEWDSG